MTLEAMDDNIIAKLLVPEGAEVTVGSPILVLIEVGADAAAFADFEAPAAATPVAAAPEPAKAVAPAPAALKPVAPTPAPTPAPAAAAPAPAPAAAAFNTSNAAAYTASVRTMHGNTPGPLHNKMAADQLAYIARFGGGLHRPLPTSEGKKK